jgi:hypothetical protein
MLRNHKTLRAWIRVIVTIVGLVFWALAMWGNGSHGIDTWDHSQRAINQATWGSTILIVYWTSALVTWPLRRIGDEAIAAIQPVPSPIEIELELRRLGHNPTIQDVASIHQMLLSRRNEHVAAAGIGIGAIFLANRGLSGHG